MDRQQLFTFLQKINQDFLLPTFSKLSLKEKHILLEQIQKIFQNHYEIPKKREERESITPLQKCSQSGVKEEAILGLEAIKNRQVGCLLLAAGTASRLNKGMAKGLIEMGPRHTSLLTHICRWHLAYKKRYNAPIFLIILVSKGNKESIYSHFAHKNFFGLGKRNILFLEQNTYPYFNLDGKWIMKNHKILEAPNGNGGFLELFTSQQVQEFIKLHQFSYMHIIPIDNPLDNPLDPNLTGHLIRKRCDAVIKGFKRDNIAEKTGVICREKTTHTIVDYMEIDPSFMGRNPQGKMHFPYANGGHYCVSIEALQKCMKKKVVLPYHWVKKKLSKETFVWKAEKFIFDIFPHFSKVRALCYPKKAFFSPIKSEGDISNLEKMLEKQYAKIYQRLYNRQAPAKYEPQVDELVSYIRMEDHCAAELLRARIK